MRGEAHPTLAERARSDEELRAAELLIGIGLFRIAVTRAYFGAFHAARALLAATGQYERQFEEVRHALQLRFVKPSALSVELGRVLSRLRTYHLEAEYADAVVVDEAAARRDLEEARGFCRAVRRLAPP